MSAPHRVVFYMHTAQFALSMSLLRELSRLCEVHVLLEVSPYAWQLESFELKPRDLPAGIVAADPVLADAFPPGVRSYWGALASFNLVVHHTRQSLHPASWRVSHAAVRHIRRLNPTLIHFDEGSRRMLPVLLELGRQPMVITMHDPETHSGERHWRAELDRRIFLRRASRVVVYNQALREPFAKRYSFPARRIHATQLGVHHIFREWAVGPVQRSRRTVLLFGRLSAYKGLEVLYAAAPLVAQQVPGVGFVVAGRPVASYQPPVPPTLSNGGRIEVIDRYIGNRELADLLAGASTVVCPYVDATQSGVVLTAFAFERPVVASRVGGLPEYIEDGQTGLLVPPGDPTALANALVALLGGDTLGDRLRLGAGALGRDGRLDWSKTARDVYAMYEDVAANGSG